jgi:hypothetical protein
LSPGMCSYGGNGFVTEVDGDGILRMFTVKYNECGSSGGMTESDICYSHLTVVTSPFASPKLVRERRSPDVLNIQAPPPTATKVSSIQDILASGASRGKKKGWRAKELGVFQLGSRNERFQSLLREDTKELLGFLSGLSTTGSDPRQHNNKGRNGRYTKRKNKSNPFTISYLAKAWGVGRHFPLKNIKKGREQTKEEKKSNPTQLSVINSLDAAKIHFSAKNLFIAHRVEVRTNFEKVFAYDTHTRAERFHLFREEAKGEWVVAEPNLRKYWEALSRSKIARQPQIRDNIIEVMRANPAKSFDQIAQDIGDWMPQSNNLDLAVFPMMSKRHSALLKMYSNLQAPHDEIWHTAEEVWANLGSAEIARGYILAYRIAAKVIEAGGENTFLQKQEFHSGVRTDFYDTPQGVAKKIVVVK